ncbi:MAG: diaminopimelate decarboxylase [Arenicella sp.]|jgi:diaminopimelate decarboxylase
MKQTQSDQTDMHRLAEQYGSPLYVYQLQAVTDRVNELRNRLPEAAHIYYSLKSNPLPSIVDHIVKQGCRLEVTSENELNVACASKLNTDLILYGGPGKTPEEIDYALRQGVRNFSVESWVDWQRIADLASQNKVECKALLRVNPSQALSTGLAMSGTKSQFGFEEHNLIKGWDNIQQNSNLVVQGFHIYYGSQMKDTEEVAKAITAALASVTRICEAAHFTPTVVNLGGGFPWAYAAPQQTTTLKDLTPLLEPALAQFPYRDTAELWFESGRYLSASSGTLVSTVLDIKHSKEDSIFVVLDSGINTLGGMSGIGRLPRGYTFTHLIGSQESKHGGLATPQEEGSLDGEIIEGESIEATIVGPLCSPLDCLSRKQSLPNSIAIGDLISVPNVGAYGLTASLVSFLTRPPAIEVALLNESVVGVHRLRQGHDTLTN